MYIETLIIEKNQIVFIDRLGQDGVLGQGGISLGLVKLLSGTVWVIGPKDVVAGTAEGRIFFLIVVFGLLVF